MSFHQKPWGARYKEMGDQAEAAFLALHPEAHRTGLDRPAWNVGKMPRDAMRYTPDYMLQNGFYEVMGLSSGKDGLLKLKEEKLDALIVWDTHIGPTRLWVYDSTKKQWWCQSVLDWQRRCLADGTWDTFPDNGKGYYALHVDHFGMGATPC